MGQQSLTRLEDSRFLKAGSFAEMDQVIVSGCHFEHNALE